MGNIAHSRILLLSTQRGIQRTVKRALASAGCNVDTEASEPIEAYQLVILNLNGIETSMSVFEDLEKLEKAPPILVLANDFTQDDRLIALLERGLTNVIAKHGGLTVRELIDEAELIATCGKLLTNDIFGLDKYIASSNIHVNSIELAHSKERSGAVDALSGFLDDVDCYRGLIPTIENCADELLMNAIFSAPRDEEGQPKYQNVDRKTSFALEDSERVTLNYACDGRYLLLGVEDQFGALNRDIALKYLRHGLVNERKAPRKDALGGAGVGLTMVARSISQLVINVEKEVKTEVIATFYIRSGAKAFKSQGRSLNMFYIDNTRSSQQGDSYADRLRSFLGI